MFLDDGMVGSQTAQPKTLRGNILTCMREAKLERDCASHWLILAMAADAIESKNSSSLAVSHWVSASTTP